MYLTNTTFAFYAPSPRSLVYLVFVNRSLQVEGPIIHALYVRLNHNRMKLIHIYKIRVKVGLVWLMHGERKLFMYENVYPDDMPWQMGVAYIQNKPNIGSQGKTKTKGCTQSKLLAFNAAGGWYCV